MYIYREKTGQKNEDIGKYVKKVINCLENQIVTWKMVLFRKIY